MLTFKQLIGLVVVVGLVLAGLWLPRDHTVDRVHSSVGRLHVRVPRGTEDPMIAVQVAARQRYDDALESITEFSAFLDSLRVVIQAPVVAKEQPPRSDPVAGDGGSITNDQFIALARCESGSVDDGVNTGGWRTGLYGIEGDGAGSLSPAAQRAWAQDIYNKSGARAWGVLCRGILGG